MSEESTDPVCGECGEKRSWLDIAGSKESGDDFTYVCKYCLYGTEPPNAVTRFIEEEGE